MITQWRTRLAVAAFCFLVLHVACASKLPRSGSSVDSDPDMRGRRIIGGRPAEIDLIWTTHITKVGEDSKRCSGILVNSRWMLTAAHCLLNSDEDGYLTPPGTSITYGCLDIYDSTACKRVSASKFVPHPCYTPSRDQDHDDIALIELDEEVSLGEHEFARIDGVHGTVRSTAYLRPCSAVTDIAHAGAGGLGCGNGYHARRLRDHRDGGLLPRPPAGRCPARVTVSLRGGKPVRGGQELRQLRVHVLHGRGTRFAFPMPSCARSSRLNQTRSLPGKDSCNGDSGGPAVAYMEGKPWLVGILSVGSELPHEDGGCGVEGRYGVYTYVRKYASFINTTIAVSCVWVCVCSSVCLRSLARSRSAPPCPFHSLPLSLSLAVRAGILCHLLGHASA
eukprot:2184533-Rhodomonas_salina.1